MTDKQTKAMQMALAALYACAPKTPAVTRMQRDAIEALDEALAEPAEVQEPVAWLDPWTGAKVTTDYDAYGKHGIPLYTAPQPVEREPLTRAQAKALVLKYGNDPLHLVLQVERAHGITGGQHGAE